MSIHSSERNSNQRRIRQAGIIIAVGALGVAAGDIIGASIAQGDKASDSRVRSVAAQEAVLYEEASRTAKIFEAQLRAGKPVSMAFLRGRITDHAEVTGTAREYGSIKDPIFLTPGPDTKDGAAHSDTDLDGGFVGVQSQSADHQIQISVVPFDKETMDFTPTPTDTTRSGVSSTVSVTARTLHGSLSGTYAVGEGQNPDGTLIVPGYAPEQK